ncbi:MAG: type II toxin-antitoxin system VapC family toxin [Blastocatellia bacterium]|nr:type II toxin-antitoxin system VapC family toxin [Blastocatellia bacterium]
MDINLMPVQTSSLIDANIFIYHLTGLSPDCRAYLRRVARGEVDAHVTTIILAEVLHRRMLGEAVAKNLVSSGQVLKKVKANPQIIPMLTDYITDVENILKLPLKIINVRIDDISASHALRQRHGLFVNDSINIACAQRIGLTHIVTNDNDFDSLISMTVWKPTDI